MIDSTLLQYMDDLIICSSSLEQCHRDSIKVLTKLAQGGHKVSQNKIQYCQPHDCVNESLAFTRLDLESTPIPEEEVTYFVDGSSFRDHVGNHTGYSVVKSDK